MIKNVLLLISLFLISGCSYKITRTGYQMDKTNYKNCDILIKKHLEINESLVKVGEIKLGETGFTVICNESEAIEILKREGCALSADIINITDENRPDFWSSCYRCKAEFYRYTNFSNATNNDEYYRPDQLEKRVLHDRQRNIAIAISAVMSGLIIGILTYP